MTPLMFSLRGVMIGVVLLFALLTVGLMLNVSDMKQDDPAKTSWLIVIGIMVMMTGAIAGFTWWLFTV